MPPVAGDARMGMAAVLVDKVDDRTQPWFVR
jgi:hypothetical protein